MSRETLTETQPRNEGTEKRRKIHLWCSIAVMVLIFVHSAMPADLSSAESGFIVDFLMKRFAALFGNNPETASFVVRKCAHFLEYTLLGFCFTLTAADYRPVLREPGIDSDSNPGGDPGRDPGGNPGGAPIISVLIPWAAGTLYAVTDEFHQRFVPGRSCELRDMCIDSCGVAAGVLLANILILLKKRRG